MDLDVHSNVDYLWLLAQLKLQCIQCHNTVQFTVRYRTKFQNAVFLMYFSMKISALISTHFSCNTQRENET